MNYHLACDTCEVIDGSPLAVLAVLPLTAPHRPHPFLVGHDGDTLSLVSADMLDADQPRPGWTPRPRLGPPEPGHSQPSVCPVCQALGSDDARRWSVEAHAAGDTFLHTAGPGLPVGPGRRRRAPAHVPARHRHVSAQQLDLGEDYAPDDDTPTWPAEALVTRSGMSRRKLQEILGSRAQRFRPGFLLTHYEADRCAHALNYFPHEVWPGWSTGQPENPDDQ